MKVDFSKFYDCMNPIFWDFFEKKDRCRISFGGAGSGKSHQAFQEMIYKILNEPGHNYLVCRKVANSNKTSTFALTIQIINQFGLSKLFKINKSDMSITVKSTGYMIVFKGLDDIEKIKSFTFPKGILTDIIIEEASEINQKDFDQLNVRLRGYKIGDQVNIPFQITLLLNPIIDTHWIKKEFIDKRSYQKDKVIDGKIVPGMQVYILHSTYLDNEFIDVDYAAVLEGYKDIDYEFYRVYCLGEWGSFGNIIFKNWTFAKCPYREDEFDAVFVGMDFGYNHPQVISKIGFKDGVMYSFAELCVFERTNPEIIQINKELDFLHFGERVICDSEAPDKIKEWVNHNYGAIGAHKGKGSVLRGIDYIKSQKWIIDDAACPRLAQEVQTFHWKEDKEGRVMDKEDPETLFEDAIKAHFYALEPLSRNRGKASVLSGSLSDQKKNLIEARREERKKKREAQKLIIREKRLKSRGKRVGGK